VAVGSASAIVTPEAVVLELPTASVATRIVAIGLDLAVQAALLLGVLLALAGVDRFGGGVPTWLVNVVLALAAFVILLGYACVLETVWHGRTIGKAALGLRVLTTEGAPIRFRHALIRSMLGLVDFYLPPGGATAVLTVLASPRDQRLGDLVAGTIVVRERSAVAWPGAVWFPVPWGCEAFAATLDTRRLPAEDYLLARSFLLRVDELAAGARYALGNDLAARLGARIGRWPPPGMPGEVFCACVVAVEQRRRQARGAS
jgi:uncharacterized RDD family membrane protein YckC